MGPTALFDKSFIQSLSVDESVWFDNFFIANVCPMFFVETLADLSKSIRGRSPEKEVQIIADKFPERSGTPNVHHLSACIGELLGDTIPMSGRVLIAGGGDITTSRGPAVVFERSSEARAFQRWTNREFYAAELECAQLWRSSLPVLDPETSAVFLGDLGVKALSCRNLGAAKQLAAEIVEGKHSILDAFQYVFTVLDIPEEYHGQIIGAWKAARCPPLAEYAPYTAYVTSLHFFFHIAVANKLLSTRKSNATDAAYLCYLPFCQVFVSSDRLHEKIAPLYLRDDQMFVWGISLKEDLAQLNRFYDRLPTSIKEQGVLCFAAQPPTESGFLVSEIWDRMFPHWRERTSAGGADVSPDTRKLLEEISRKRRTASRRPTGVVTDAPDPMVIAMQRRVRRKKGSWLQVPKGVEDSSE